MIDISHRDFGTLCICALRYCMGRRTYMPSLVQGIVRSHFFDLADEDLRILRNDKQWQSDMELYGDPCDKTSWEKFWNDLDCFISAKETDCPWK